MSMAEPWYARPLEAVRPLLPVRWGDGAVVPVVRMSGTIGFSTPLKPGLTLSSIAKALDKAFSTRNAKAIALLINSPGGSPVQSHLIFRRVRQLAEEKGLPVLAFVEDVAASGGYMIACAADEIICDPSSIVGSIGVVGGTFGFDKLLEKVGIERRLYTSGDRKAMLDPFLPEKPEDVKRLKDLQQEIHQLFIDLVKTRRGARLDAPEKTLFSGEYWTGMRAIELGIADLSGDLRAVLRERYGENVRTPVMAAEPSFSGAGFLAFRFRTDCREAVRILPKSSYRLSRRACFGRATGFDRGCGAATCGAPRTEGETAMASFVMSPMLKWSLVTIGGAVVAHQAIKIYREVRARDMRANRSTIHDRGPYPTLRRDPVSGEFRIS